MMLGHNLADLNKKRFFLTPKWSLLFLLIVLSLMLLIWVFTGIKERGCLEFKESFSLDNSCANESAILRFVFSIILST